MIFQKQTFPFFGILPELLSEDGQIISEPHVEGYLVKYLFHVDIFSKFSKV